MSPSGVVGQKPRYRHNSANVRIGVPLGESEETTPGLRLDADQR